MKPENAPLRPYSFVNEPYSNKSGDYRIIGAKFRVEDLETAGISVLSTNIISIPLLSHNALVEALKGLINEHYASQYAPGPVRKKLWDNAKQALALAEGK